MMNDIYFHLPGLFEFNELYKRFLSLYDEHQEYFYKWAKIGSIYGSPEGSIWSGGRTSFGTNKLEETLNLINKYHISPRLTFSNSELTVKDLDDKFCNEIVRSFNKECNFPCGVIVYSDLLLNYLKDKYPNFYYVSSTTKVLTDFNDFKDELDRDDFKYVVPDFRLNKEFKKLETLSNEEKDKVEFLVNECCYVGCNKRKECYKNVSLKNLGGDVKDFKCEAPDLKDGYSFSLAMKNPMFISNKDIVEEYIPRGFSNFKIEGRGLGSALVLEFLLYYMVKPEYQINVREAIYLDNMLDLF